MRQAYIDSSVVVAIELAEGPAHQLVERLQGFDVLLSATLLEAEVRSVLSREGFSPEVAFFDRLRWVSPPRSLGKEITTALSVGYLRGADLWHVACALYIADSPSQLSFLTLDKRQNAVAADLGFPVFLSRPSGQPES